MHKLSTRVKLECGHVRKVLTVSKGGYYCIECDDHFQIIKVLPSQYSDDRYNRVPSVFNEQNVKESTMP